MYRQGGVRFAGDAGCPAGAAGPTEVPAGCAGRVVGGPVATVRLVESDEQIAAKDDLVLDPGHDDYFETGRAELAELSRSPFLART